MSPQADALMQSVRSFEAARAALGVRGVSWAADLARLDALVHRYPEHARRILRQVDGARTSEGRPE